MSTSTRPGPGPRLGHQAVVPPRIGAAPEPLDPAVQARLAGVSSADVSDLVGRLWTMDAGIRPLYQPIARIAGPAVTVRLPPGDNWALAAALTEAGPGQVLVVDWMGYHDGCGSGANAIAHAVRHGVAGIVIDGCWRDVEEIAALGFPIFGRGVSPYSPPKEQAGEVNVPVSCGGVVVEPGDVVVADREGVAVVPRRAVADVTARLPETPTAVRTRLEEYPERSSSLERRAAAFRDTFGPASTEPSREPSRESSR